MRLSDGSVCRLCGEENPRGVPIYGCPQDGLQDISTVVNHYLPLKVQDDGKLPRTICPGCHIQLQATVSFFDLMVEGQKKLRELRKAEQKLEATLKIPFESVRKGDELILDEITNVFQIGDELYAGDHTMTLRIEGLEKPKRKRGRPRKSENPPLQPIPLEAATLELKEPILGLTIKRDPELEEQEMDSDGKKKRKRKVPLRFQEAVQGKEMERIFLEEGVIDDEEHFRDRDEQVSEVLNSTEQEIIGHMESEEGQELGDVVVLNKAGGSNTVLRKKIHFQCEICSETFIQQAKFLEHKAAHVISQYQCGSCEGKFKTKEELDVHQKTEEHSGVTVIGFLQSSVIKIESESFKCSTCEKEFDCRTALSKHINVEHSEKKKKYSCPICRKQFRFNCSLKGHMLSSHKSQKVEVGFPCDICGKNLKHPSSVTYHKEAEHNNGRRFVCNKCGKSFKHRQLLRRHQLVHSEKRPYYCKQCSASFKTKANLLNHMLTHSGEKKFFCEICGKQFAHKTSLTLHYRWHSGQKPYQCDVCKKTFSQKGNLEEHMRIHTGEKPFLCTLCRRRFTTSSQYKLHVKRHTGERPWKCDYCGKSYLHKDTWKCHMRRHRGEKPYRCSYCSRDFPEMWALKKHERLHTGERPYTCPTCGKTFADCSNLTKHKKVHGKQNEGGTTIKKVEERGVGSLLPTQAGGGVDFWNMIRSEVEETTTPSSDEKRNAESTDLQQIIYVTYQDPADPNAKVVSEKFLLGTGCDLNGIEERKEEEEDISNMQVMDEHGNPIFFTMSDGTQLQVTTCDGKSLQVTTMEDEVIPVRLTTAEGQPLIAQLTPVSNGLTPLGGEGEDGLSLEDGETDIEFITDDCDEVQMISSLNSASLQIPSPYLTIG